MRLIDADKLHYIRKWFEDGSKSAVVVFAKEIDKAPTVEAITVEWMKSYSERVSDYSVSSLYKKATIKQMLEDWEKENEHK